MKKTLLTLALGLAIMAIGHPVFAQVPAPVPNKGDTAWMMTSTLLIILMTVPGLALFYGGLVRSKNMLSVLMQVMVTFSMIVVLWFIYGYSLAFTGGNPFFGGLDRLFMRLILGFEDMFRAAAEFPGETPTERAHAVSRCERTQRNSDKWAIFRNYSGLMVTTQVSVRSSTDSECSSRGRRFPVGDPTLSHPAVKCAG